jgi:hypothetical protein
MIHGDERTIDVETASYRWAYLVLSFGLLIMVAYRSFVHHESSWDMLGLVVLGGLVSTAYQAFHGALSRQWAIACLLTVLASAVVGALIARTR